MSQVFLHILHRTQHNTNTKTSNKFSPLPHWQIKIRPQGQNICAELLATLQRVSCAKCALSDYSALTRPEHWDCIIYCVLLRISRNMLSASLGELLEYFSSTTLQDQFRVTRPSLTCGPGILHHCTPPPHRNHTWYLTSFRLHESSALWLSR